MSFDDGCAASCSAGVVGGGGIALGVDLLRGDEAVTEGEVRERKTYGDGDLLQRADDRDGVHVVEEAEVGDAEDRALHLALAVGDDGGELRA